MCRKQGIAHAPLPNLIWPHVWLHSTFLVSLSTTHQNKNHEIREAEYKIVELSQRIRNSDDKCNSLYERAVTITLSQFIGGVTTYTTATQYKNVCTCWFSSLSNIKAPRLYDLYMSVGWEFWYSSLTKSLPMSFSCRRMQIGLIVRLLLLAIGIR